MTRNKQSVGIDISKDSFTACLCTSQKDGSLQYSNVLSFKNEKQGYNQLLRWIRKHHQKETELVYLMEATGVYYESLSYHLNNIKQKVHVVCKNENG